jgi:hypothetical protein
MWKLTAFLVAASFLGEVGAFTNMLLVAVGTLFTVPKDCEGATHSAALADVNVGIHALRALVASTIICKMHANRYAFWCRIMGQRTLRGINGTVALHKPRTDGDFVGIVFIRTRLGTFAET